MRARHEALPGLPLSALADLPVMLVGAATAPAAVAAAAAVCAAIHANREVVSTVATFPLESPELPEGVADQEPPVGTKAHACRLEALRAAAAASSFHPEEGDDPACRESVAGREPAIVMISAAFCATEAAFSSRPEPAGTLRPKDGGEPKASCKERLGASVLLIDVICQGCERKRRRKKKMSRFAITFRGV